MAGETKTVYDEIEALGTGAFSPDIYVDIQNILKETFKRVRYNLDIIYQELKAVNYLFKTKISITSNIPLHPPLPGNEKLLSDLELTVAPFGHLPLSLKMFYRIVGSCNFCWDYETNEGYKWTLADPIEISSLDDVISEFDKDYIEQLEEEFEEEGFIGISLSADSYTKENISGGPSYKIKITPEPSIDSEFLNEEHQTTFINYLRICFDNCGFPRMTHPDNQNDYQTFFDKVKPQLLRI